MPNRAKIKVVAPEQGGVSVRVYHPNGSTAANAFTTETGSTAVTWPLSIAAGGSGTVWVQEGPHVVSVVLGGVEVAAGFGDRWEGTVDNDGVTLVVVPPAGVVASGGVAVAVADGGTGASTAAGARGSLGVTDWRAGYVAAKYAPDLADRPTVTWDLTGATSTLTTPVTYRPAICGGGSQVTNWNGQSDTHFRFSHGLYRTGNGVNLDLALYGLDKSGIAGAPWPLVYEFDLSAGADRFELSWFHPGGAVAFGLEVNGHWYGLFSSRVSRTGSCQALINFGAASGQVRRVRVWDTSQTGMYEVRVPTGQSITKPTDTLNRRVGIVGDSFVNGAGGAATAWATNGAGYADSFAGQLVRLLGAQQPIMAGAGGTGFTTTPANNFNSRADELGTFNPHLLVTVGSVTDPQAGTGAQAKVEEYCATLASNGFTGRHIIVGALRSGWEAYNAALQAGAAAAGATYISPALIGASITGTGTLTAPVNSSGNASLLVQSDNVHPTWAAHRAIAVALFYAITDVWP